MLTAWAICAAHLYGLPVGLLLPLPLPLLSCAAAPPPICHVCPMPQILLRIGVLKSLQGPTTQFNYGYLRDRFVWSLISAVGIFFLGAGEGHLSMHCKCGAEAVCAGYPESGCLASM